MSVTYETPDGDKCLEKTIATTIIGGKIGFILGVYDAVGGYAAKSFFPFVSRVVYWTGPAAMMGAAFSTGVCLSSHVRGGKNDVINHGVGGAFMAGAFGMKAGARKGWIFAPIFGVIFMLARQFKDEGGNFVPDGTAKKDFGIVGNSDFSIGPRRNYEEPTQY